MKPFARADRVGGQIQKVLSEILRKKIKDSRLEMTTITGVKMSQDLRLAKIYYATTGSKKNKDEVAEGFKHALGYIKRSLARQLGLRYMPDLRFYYDESFEYGSHIDEVLKSIRTENGSNNTSFEE